MSDWLKLHRKSLESRVFSDPKLWRLWCWCLLKSNWKRGWYFGCEIQPGQFAIGREAASEELGVSGSSWYRAMQKLQELGCIKLQANNRFTIVSIVNWQKYQGEVNNKRTTSGQPVDNQRTTGEQLPDTIEEGLKFQEGLEGNNSLSFSRHGKDKRFQECWDKWLAKSTYQNGRSLDSITEQSQLYKLDKYDTEEAIEVVMFCLSLANCKNLLADGQHKKQKPDSTESSGSSSGNRGAPKTFAQMRVDNTKAAIERFANG